MIKAVTGRAAHRCWHQWQRHTIDRAWLHRLITKWAKNHSNSQHCSLLWWWEKENLHQWVECFGIENYRINGNYVKCHESEVWFSSACLGHKVPRQWQLLILCGILGMLQCRNLSLHYVTLTWRDSVSCTLMGSDSYRKSVTQLLVHLPKEAPCVGYY